MIASCTYLGVCAAFFIALMFTDYTIALLLSGIGSFLSVVSIVIYSIFPPEVVTGWQAILFHRFFSLLNNKHDLWPFARKWSQKIGLGLTTSEALIFNGNFNNNDEIGNHCAACTFVKIRCKNIKEIRNAQ